MSNPGKPNVVTTRWWWVRHAPVREDGGCIYGQKDLGCDTSDRVVFEAVGKILPRNAVWCVRIRLLAYHTASRGRIFATASNTSRSLVSQAISFWP